MLTTVLVLGSIFMFTPPQDKINQGLDIQGGLSVVLSAKSTDGDAVTSEDMEKSRAIIEQRVNALGASEDVYKRQALVPTTMWPQLRHSHTLTSLFSNT